MLSGTHHQRQSLFHVFTPNAFPILATFPVANDLGFADRLLYFKDARLERKTKVCGVSVANTTIEWVVVSLGLGGLLRNAVFSIPPLPPATESSKAGFGVPKFVAGSH
jgi:hypothetical protein